MGKKLNLKIALFEKGLSQQALAKKSGVPPSYISLALHGKYNLDSEQQKRISRVLGKRREELFGES